MNSPPPSNEGISDSVKPLCATEDGAATAEVQSALDSESAGFPDSADLLASDSSENLDFRSLQLEIESMNYTQENDEAEADNERAQQHTEFENASQIPPVSHSAASSSDSDEVSLLHYFISVFPALRNSGGASERQRAQLEMTITSNANIPLPFNWVGCRANWQLRKELAFAMNPRDPLAAMQTREMQNAINRRLSQNQETKQIAGTPLDNAFLMVTALVRESPAHRAGLRCHDFIIRFGDFDASNWRENDMGNLENKFCRWKNKEFPLTVIRQTSVNPSIAASMVKFSPDGAANMENGKYVLIHNPPEIHSGRSNNEINNNSNANANSMINNSNSSNSVISTQLNQNGDRSEEEPLPCVVSDGKKVYCFQQVDIAIELTRETRNLGLMLQHYPIPLPRSILAKIESDYENTNSNAVTKGVGIVKNGK